MATGKPFLHPGDWATRGRPEQQIRKKHKPAGKSSEGIHKSAVKDVPTKVLENELKRRGKSKKTPKSSEGIHKSAPRKASPGKQDRGR